MRNPYEILEIREGSSKEEIKRAYRELAKKYHPDQYGNNPLRDLAEEKMRAINEAYDYLMRTTNDYGSSGSNSGSNNSYNNSNSYADYSSIRMDIQLGHLTDAEAKLSRISSRNAEWNYLMGMLNLKKGWYDSAINYLRTAIAMDPSNMEYRDTLSRINNMNNNYRQPYRNSRYGRDSDFCDICTTLYCLDCFCECCGGDLISCC